MLLRKQIVFFGGWGGESHIKPTTPEWNLMNKRNFYRHWLAVVSHTGEDKQGFTAIDRQPWEAQWWHGFLLTHLPAHHRTDAGSPPASFTLGPGWQNSRVQLCPLWSGRRACRHARLPTAHTPCLDHGVPLWCEIFCSKGTRACTWWRTYVLEVVVVVVGGNDKSREFRSDGNGLFRTRTFLDSLYQAGGVWTLSLVIVWLHGKACPSVIQDPGSDSQQHRKAHSLT